jgi:hypothetical protein
MTDTPDPQGVAARAAVRKLVEDKIDGAGTALEDLPHCIADLLADAVMELFEVDQETWFIATVPAANGPVDLKFQVRQPDREPVTHTRFVLRTEPVPVQPGGVRGVAPCE